MIKSPGSAGERHIVCSELWSWNEKRKGRFSGISDSTGEYKDVNGGGARE